MATMMLVSVLFGKVWQLIDYILTSSEQYFSDIQEERLGSCFGLVDIGR